MAVLLVAFLFVFSPQESFAVIDAVNISNHGDASFTSLTMRLLHNPVGLEGTNYLDLAWVDRWSGGPLPPVVFYQKR
jgi:hypothetical protein